jgi:hypothetical protein
MSTSIRAERKETQIKRACMEKLGYTSKELAVAASRAYEYMINAVPAEPYKCDYCGMWHLTTTPHNKD